MQFDMVRIWTTKHSLNSYEFNSMIQRGGFSQHRTFKNVNEMAEIVSGIRATQAKFSDINVVIEQAKADGYEFPDKESMDLTLAQAGLLGWNRSE